MLLSINNQALIFLYTVFGGIVLGLVYDLFRVSRKIIPTVNFVVHIEDIIFWSIGSIITFLTLFISNAGDIRGYAIIGIALGVIIYFLLFSQFVTKFLINIIKFVISIIKIIIKIIKVPIIILIKVFSYPINYICKLVRKIIKFFKKISHNILRRFKFNIKNVFTSFKKI